MSNPTMVHPSLPEGGVGCVTSDLEKGYFEKDEETASLEPIASKSSYNTAGAAFEKFSSYTVSKMIKFRATLVGSGGGHASGSYALALRVRSKAWSRLTNGGLRTIPLLLLMILTPFLLPIGDPFNNDKFGSAGSYVFVFCSIPICGFGFGFALAVWMLK